MFKLCFVSCWFSLHYLSHLLELRYSWLLKWFYSLLYLCNTHILNSILYKNIKAWNTLFALQCATLMDFDLTFSKLFGKMLQSWKHIWSLASKMLHKRKYIKIYSMQTYSSLFHWTCFYKTTTVRTRMALDNCLKDASNIKIKSKATFWVSLQ